MEIIIKNILDNINNTHKVILNLYNNIDTIIDIVKHCSMDKDILKIHKKVNFYD